MAPVPDFPSFPAEDHFVITINRDFGSLGRPIARRLAQLLGVEFYDRDIVEATAKRLKQPISVISDAEEQKASGFFRMLFPLGRTTAPHQKTLFETQAAFIQQVASTQSCIVVGRCADYVLRDHPNTMNVFIYAPYADRLANCVGPLKMDKRIAKKMIAGVDKARAAYHKYWAGYPANDPEHNHIIINSALLEVEGTAQALAAIARVRFHLAGAKGGEDDAAAKEAAPPGV